MVLQKYLKVLYLEEVIFHDQYHVTRGNNCKAKAETLTLCPSTDFLTPYTIPT